MAVSDSTVPTPTRAARESTSAEMAHTLQELSRQAIRQAVDASAGNVSQAARRLGISRQTLYRKLGDVGGGIRA